MICRVCATPATVQGRSFAKVLTGEEKSARPFVVGYFRKYQRMIRTDSWKLIVYPEVDRIQLFNLRADPLERHDVARDESNAAVVQRLRNQLAEWLRERGDTLADRIAPRPE